MSVEDLIQLLILGGAGLAWLLGGAKSRKAPPQPRPQPRQLPRPPERLPSDGMAEEIYRILSGEVEEQREREESLEVIREEAAPLRETLEDVREAEAYSLETLEPAGEASHRRFHEKYSKPLAPPPQPPLPLHVPALGGGSLRQAILWHEILGPPKAFKDDARFPVPDR